MRGAVAVSRICARIRTRPHDRATPAGTTERTGRWKRGGSGRPGRRSGVIGFGAWAIGGTWGRPTTRSCGAARRPRRRDHLLSTPPTSTATAAANGCIAPLPAGAPRALLRRHQEPAASPQVPATTPRAPRGLDRRQPRNLDVETASTSSSCTARRPTSTTSPEVFAALDELVAEADRALRRERRARRGSLKAIEYPASSRVQIIFNMFRQRRPNDSSPGEARDVGVLARVRCRPGCSPASSTPASTFEADDHRAFNRHGESFDVGETFSGVDYETGLAVVEEVRPLVPEGTTLAQSALRWILMSTA